jgi:HD-GYP domain-containing protein (c-di-GMP phosphodiesterase class II)
MGSIDLKSNEILALEAKRKTADEILALEGKRKTEAMGKDIIVCLNALFRTTRVHSIDNEASQKVIQRTLNLTEALLKTEYEVELYYVGQDFYLNQQRIKVSPEIFNVFEMLSGELRERSVGRILFTQRPPEKELADFTICFNTVNLQADDVFQELQALMLRKGIVTISISPYEEDIFKELPKIEKSQFVKQTYFQSITLVSQIMGQARTGRPIKLKVVKRIVQKFIDILMDQSSDRQDDLLMMLTRVKNWLNYHENHCVNVCILCLQVGIAMGFSRTVLRQLGTAAMLHDIGFVKVPREVLDKFGELTEAEWKLIREHPVSAVALVSNLQEFDPIVVKTMLSAFSHHKGYDFKGYPSFGPEEHNIFADIIAVADMYDAMTTSRPFRTVPLSNEEVLRQIVAESGGHLHPFIVKKFIEVVGMHPLGSLVLLDTGEIGLVVGRDIGAKNKKPPTIKVLKNIFGLGGEGEMMDLSEQMPDKRSYKRNIAQSIDPVDAKLAQKIIAETLAYGSGKIRP